MVNAGLEYRTGRWVMMVERISDGAGEAKKGLWYAFGCYAIWGLFPLYWYPLAGSALGADQLLAQRVVWSAVFSVLLAVGFGQWPVLRSAMGDKRVLLTFLASAAAISVNWLVYLWAIKHNHVLDASLGYFISPLFSIWLGRIFFNERLNRIQMAAISLAVVGILWLALPSGRIPWVALILTVSFGLYGLLRKKAPLDVLPAMALETLMMLPFALGYLLWCGWRGELVFSELPPLQMGILLGSGAVTTIPLLLFAAGAKRISLSNLGMIQYFSPTCQFVIGLLVFQEAFSMSRFIGYVWVWLGVAVYLLGIWQKQKNSFVQRV
ncbi:EamA family transporter RarD [Neisseria weaveri]|uniref:Putative chloramphenical resistance permease RarD n=1 Tax=Neisseria weaveri TaxID=28091 RepID=A0A3S4Z4P3_9NEIS|nr:EamA family transporter RarD [Neisseria weaveri]EGV36888.1 DMT superfamily drug/metabolite transporter [Neisseria weaveri ATCC 51223]EGV38966.1 DMT superfamily drug/metabolite transporter [Neisseria weaveri LMG 5135]SAY52027.1 putative chloramphenical resistance permease RarD [Neisseria weaveri]VEJ51447.1 putative chloramphenical resistance permease RarD [Neisseria weaveri]